MQLLGQHVAELRAVLEGVVGLYHDARSGFHLTRDRLIKTQQQIIAQHPDNQELNSTEVLDTKRHFYGKGEPWADSSLVQHVSTQADFKRRNAPDGDNHRLIGSLCVVAFYNYWEDHYRELISRDLGHTSKTDLKAPIFGDLRRLRKSIVHHRGVALKEIEACELLKWFREGEVIFISEPQFDELVGHIRAFLDTLLAA
jgi:hypothetical protein